MHCGLEMKEIVQYLEDQNIIYKVSMVADCVYDFSLFKIDR